MAEFKAGEIPENVLMKAKNLKKTAKMVKKLSDDDVDNVAGGFWLKKGYAAGSWVECPICGCNVKEGIYSWDNDEYEATCFYCKMCDFVWALDDEGYSWEP